MLSILTETQRAIVETITMRLHIVQALQYVKDAGFEMSRAKYFRQKKKIEGMRMERMQHIARYFPDQHLERVDKCELIEKLMWENYRTGDIKRVDILGEILNMQVFLSGYYDVTRYVLENTIKTEADYRTRHAEPYLSFNVKEKREKEIKKDQETKRFRIIDERNREIIRQNNEPLNRTPNPKAIED